VGGSGTIKASSVVNNGTINPGYAGIAGTLTLSNNLVVNQGATNYFDLSDNASGTPSDLIKVTGNVGFQGSSIIGIGALNGTIVSGTYPLIRYTGIVTNETGVVPAGPISNVMLGGDMANTTRATMSVVNASGEIDLTVSSINSSNLIWTGSDTTNTWDVVLTSNFKDAASGLASQFFQFDNVTFNDTGVTNQLYLVGSLAPNSITVSSSSNYIFGGPGSIIGDGSLSKSGTGSLLLTNGSANAFAGGTVINGGIIKAGVESGGNQNDRALGIGPVTINTGGQLRLGGNSGGVVQHFITNNIVINGGTLYVADGNQHLTNSTVTVNANGATLSTLFSTKNLVLDSPLTGTGNVTITSATNAAAAQVILNNTNNTISGNVTIATNGNLALIGYAGLSNSPVIDVQQGSVFDVTGKSNVTWAAVSGQTLQGAGIIRGKLINLLAGSTVAPGVPGAIGSLTVTNNNATNTPIITFSGTVNMDINRALAVNSDRIINSNGTNNFGGTLNVNNLGAALQAGDTFTLFTGLAYNGAFTTVNLPTLTGGLTWNNTLAVNGKITVVGAVVAPTVPPAITNFSLLNGTNVVLNGTNGQAGATYYLLSTTNVAAPIVQWKTVATNLGAGNAFSFTGTNAVNPALGKQYYMLSSTNYNP
jgi:autotransporter-associated beta strand protein